MPIPPKRHFFIALIACIFITVSVFAISKFYLTRKSEVLGQKTSIVRLGLGKLANNIYFYAGIEAGIFAKYGIEFDLKDQPTSLDSINTLIANQIDLSGAISLDNGLNALVSDPKSFQILTVGTEGQGENALNTALITNSNSNISSLKDLENKKIAVQPGPFSITALRYVLNKAGVDISKTEFISITLADQLPALQAGSIDAAFTFEPYVSLAQQKGFKILDSGILSKYYPNGSFGAIFISSKFVKEKPQIARNISQALSESIEYVRQNNVQSHSILPKYLAIDPEIAETVKPLIYQKPEEINTEEIQKYVDFSVEQKIIKSKIEIANLIYKP